MAGEAGVTGGGRRRRGWLLSWAQVPSRSCKMDDEMCIVVCTSIHYYRLFQWQHCSIYLNRIVYCPIVNNGNFRSWAG